MERTKNLNFELITLRRHLNIDILPMRPEFSPEGGTAYQIVDPPFWAGSLFGRREEAVPKVLIEYLESSVRS